MDDPFSQILHYALETVVTNITSSRVNVQRLRVIQWLYQGNEYKEEKNIAYQIVSTFSLATKAVHFTRFYISE